MTQTVSGSRAASTARSTTHDFSLLLSNIPFQICFVFLITIIGPLYLFVWTLDTILVALLNKIHCGLQAIFLETTDTAEGMDRFTRTKEHYLRGGYRRECPRSETPAAPPAADLVFDFDFKDSKLDLGFDIGKPFVQDMAMKTTHTTDPEEDIGLALSDGLSCKQRGQPSCAVTKEDPDHCEKQQDEWISSAPTVPNEMHVRFSARCDQPSRNFPPCSIYSREWRQRVSRTVSPPEQTAYHIPAEEAVHFSERISTNDVTAPDGLDPENEDGADEEASSLPEPFLKSPDKTEEGSSSPPESIIKKGRKRLSTIGKWLLRPRSFLEKRASISNGGTSVKTMLSNTATPSPLSGSFPDASNHRRSQRIGDALQTRVARKQAEAQSQFRPTRSPTESLRGGGSFNSVGTGRRRGDGRDGYNPRRRGTHRHRSSGIFTAHNHVFIFAENEHDLDDVHSPRPPPRRPVHRQPRRPRSPRGQPWLPYPRLSQNRNQDPTDGLHPPTQVLPANLQTRIQIHRRPGRRTQASEDDRGGLRPGQHIRRPGSRRPEHRAQGSVHQEQTRTSPSTVPRQTADTPPHRLSEESQSSQVSSSHRSRPTRERTQQNHPSPHRSDPSLPIAGCDKKPEIRDDSCQVPSQARPSQSEQRTGSTHGTSIRLSMSDGRVLSTSEYKALQEKRAGKTAVRPNDTYEDRNEAVPGAETKVEVLQRKCCPASAGGATRDKSSFAGRSPKEVRLPGASQQKVQSGKPSSEEEIPKFQRGVMGASTQSRKPVLERQNTERPPLAADTKARSAGPLLVTKQDKEATTSNVKSNEHSTAITGMSSQYPATVPGFSTSQQLPPTAKTSSQQSTTHADKVSGVDLSPTRPSTKQRHATRSQQNTTTAESSRLRGCDNENGPKELSAKKDSEGNEQVETEGQEPTWSFANLKL